MTSYRPPDYDVDVAVTSEEFEAIAGVAFSVTFLFEGSRVPVSGMLIVPQGNDFPSSENLASAWLWCKGIPNLPEGSKVAITLGGPSDPMVGKEDEAHLAAYSGRVFNGVVTGRR